MTRVLTGKTSVVGILGWPLDHSLSPLMQNAALEAAGLDWVYVPFPVHPDSLAVAVAGLKELGVQGFNVTIPHKSAIIPHLDMLAPSAELSGAVNTVIRSGGKLIGHNTDGVGLVNSLTNDLSFDPHGSEILMLGAGGAARGALAALCETGVARISVANRTLQRAENLTSQFGEQFPGIEFAALPLDPECLGVELSRVDLLLNTTSIGMHGSECAGLDLSRLKAGAVVYDMVYVPEETPLIKSALARGIPCANGIGMLAGQGEVAFRLWTGKDPMPGLMLSRLREYLSRNDGS